MLQHGTPEQQVEALAYAGIATQPAAQEPKPIGKVLSEEEMGIGYDRKAGPVLWFGQPGTGFIYAAPPAAQDVSGLCELIDDVCEWFELRGLHELNIYKALKEASRAQAQGGDAKPECKCSMRTRAVGDGCSICNPELAAEYARDADE